MGNALIDADRLSRNQNHIGVLFDDADQFSVRLEFVTEKFADTVVGRFILAARAFVAEVEREKIVERTQRGKAQRARSGKLPQATGRGIYGTDMSSKAGLVAWIHGRPQLFAKPSRYLPAGTVATASQAA